MPLVAVVVVVAAVAPFPTMCHLQCILASSRVRQPSKDGEPSCIQVHPTEQQIVIGRDRQFTFDYTFDCGASQTEVYEQSVQPLVEA